MTSSNSKLRQAAITSPPSPAWELLVLPLLYFEIFSHPLTAEELYQFSHTEIEPEEFRQQLHWLVDQKLLHEMEGHYATAYKPEWLQRRRKNEARAKKYVRRARWAVKLMRHFPFVRAVFISGSLSKGVIAHDGDVDYFIVTQPERLWIT